MIFHSATRDKLHFIAMSDEKWSSLCFYNDTGNKLFKIGTIISLEKFVEFANLRQDRLDQHIEDAVE
jgi:hypothetical protein